MIASIVELLLLALAVAGIIAAGFVMVYDIRRINRETQTRTAVHKMQTRRQPQASILIPYVESTHQLQECLTAIRHSRYSHYDIVAVMDNLSNQERRRVYGLMGMVQLRIYAPRATYTAKQRIANAYRRSKRGDIVLVLNASDRLEPSALKRAIVQLRSDVSLDGVELIGRLSEATSLAGVYMAFMELSARLLWKIQSLFTTRHRPIRGAMIYRRDILLRALKSGASIRTVRDSGLASADTPYNYDEPNVRLRTLLAGVLFIAMVAYSSVLAATLQTTWPLVTSWALVGLWLLMVIWSDDANSMTRKLGLSLYVPVGYFIVAAGCLVKGAGLLARRQTF